MRIGYTNASFNEAAEKLSDFASVPMGQAKNFLRSRLEQIQFVDLDHDQNQPAATEDHAALGPTEVVDEEVGVRQDERGNPEDCVVPA